MSTKTVTGEDIVAKAREYKGNAEVPTGSNTGPFVEGCQRDTFLAGTGWPWCAAFVCRVAKDCGVPLAYDGAGAHDLADHHKPWVAAADVHVGMVVDYNIGTGHTGIVTSVDLASGTLTSCDGNWSDAVTEHTMPLSEVRSFWAIPGVQYGKVVVPPKPKPRRVPAFVIATSAGGERKVLFATRVRDGGKGRVARWIRRHTIPANGITVRRVKRVVPKA